MGRGALPARGEDPAVALAPGTARRRALDEALAEIDAGAARASPQWKVRFGLMLGLERVLAEQPPHLASGTELRRHQVDALAGMLTELIAANQRRTSRERQRRGRGAAPTRRRGRRRARGASSTSRGRGRRRAAEPLDAAEDPGAVRRYRFRHPTASGKTIAAAGFVEAARTLGVLILTHRRLLVTQFQRELTDRGLRRPAAPSDRERRRAAAGEPDHDPDLRLVRPPRRRARRARRTSS